ncbi:MAG: SPOR domain-containing protein [Pseudomonadota bacterium]
MKIVFFALLIMNAFIAGWIYWKEASRIDTGFLQQQIQPEKIRIVPLEEARSAGPRTAPAVAACLEWGVLAREEAERARSRLESEGLGAKTSARTTEQSASVWVYLPPAPSRDETSRRIEELKSKGLTDYFLVQDPGRWRNAISLGLFRSAESADKFLEEVRAKGFDYAELSQRGPKEQVVTLVIRDPSDAEAARVAAMRGDFPGTELKAIPCE